MQGEACIDRMCANKFKKINSLTQRSVGSQFWIFEYFLKTIWKINIWALDFLEMEMFDSNNILFDSAQC